MNCCTPGFPVLLYLPEFGQTHFHWVDDAIQSSLSLSPPSPALHLSQYQGKSWLSMSWLFVLGGQSNGASASVTDPPVNIQDWFPSGLTGLISLLSKGLSSLLQHHSSKASILQCSAFFMVQLSHPHMTAGKPLLWLDGLWWINKYFQSIFRSHHFMANRWGNSGNSVRLYLGGLQNHCRWWLQPWN